jgi:hypothetical protein
MGEEHLHERVHGLPLLVDFKLKGPQHILENPQPRNDVTLGARGKSVPHFLNESGPVLEVRLSNVVDDVLEARPRGSEGGDLQHYLVGARVHCLEDVCFDEVLLAISQRSAGLGLVAHIRLVLLVVGRLVSPILVDSDLQEESCLLHDIALAASVALKVRKRGIHLGEWRCGRGTRRSQGSFGTKG